MKDYSAQTKAALVTIWLLTEGPLTVATVADRLYETQSGAWKLLNDIGGDGVPLVNDRGWWYLDIKALSDVRHIHELTGTELDAVPPNALYTRLFKRTDVERIHRMTGELLRVGLPTGKSAGAIVEEEELVCEGDLGGG